MSDNFKVLGVGGAGVNVVRALGYENSLYIDSNSFGSMERVVDFVNSQVKGTKVVVVSSPAGQFSSSVLKPVCSALNSNGNKVFFIGIMPFHSESPERKVRGDMLMRELKRSVEITSVVENENFASSMKEYPWTNVLAKINEHIDSLVKSIVSENVKSLAGENSSISKQVEQSGFQSSVSISLN
ncbi:MAG: hypothetical protein M1386_00110 [Candidatus Thermoplasmatota archaeon]|jgi:cell division GTPase FtsZ|nr:hypothetical protein [Candidatus Thermoplasmatota archaeon]